MSETKECPHDVMGKYLVAQGTLGHSTGYLACEECLTNTDFKTHPGWKERLATRDKRAEQLNPNLGRTPADVVTVVE